MNITNNNNFKVNLVLNKFSKKKKSSFSKDGKTKNNKGKITLKTKFKKLWEIVPFFIKFMSFTTLFIYILNIFFKIFSFYLSNVPFYTLYRFQFWRIITSFLVTTNILNIIFGLIFWTREGSSMEERLGTVKYIIIFLRNNILIQIIYTIIISILSFLLRNKDFMLKKLINNKEDGYKVENVGLCPAIICEITLLCLSNPNTSVKFLFIPFKFSAKYYPFLCLILFCLINIFNFNNEIELLVGILFAYIHQKYLKNYLNISDSIVEIIEKKLCCECIKKISGFVSVNRVKNKFGGKKINQRMSGVKNLVKINNKMNKKNKNEDTERDVKINSENVNPNDSSIISIVIPKKSLFDRSFRLNKNLP